MIGIVGLALVLAISIYQFATHGVGEPGRRRRARLHSFAAPLAPRTSTATPTSPPRPAVGAPATIRARRSTSACSPERGPLVLAFFVTGAGAVRAAGRRAPDAARPLPGRCSSRRWRSAADRGDRARCVRAHRWTIPVAYDRDGRVGRPLRGGRSARWSSSPTAAGSSRDRLIGDRWQTRGGARAARRGRCARSERRRVSDEPQPAPRPGFVDPSWSAEFPGLRLRWVTVAARRASPARPSSRSQLRELSNRYRGASVVAMRTKPDPAGLPRLLSPDRPRPRRATASRPRRPRSRA